MLFAEDLITLAQAARIVPKRRVDKPTSPATLYRWATKGLRGVRLEVIAAGGVLCTSREAIGRFFNALTEQREELRQPVTRLNAQRLNEIKEADRLAADILK